MVIDAVRYAIGRQSYQVGITAKWLCANWLSLPEYVKGIILKDLKQAFAEDDYQRALHSEYKRLGADMDRREWQAVLAVATSGLPA